MVLESTSTCILYYTRIFVLCLFFKSVGEKSTMGAEKKVERHNNNSQQQIEALIRLRVHSL